MQNLTYIDGPEDMQWLADVHTRGNIYGAAIITGNEDSPERIECWQSTTPLYLDPPNAVYTLQPDGSYSVETFGD